jgi:hypothetical protein
MNFFSSSDRNTYLAQGGVILVVVGFFLAAIFLGGCGTTKYGIEFNDHTGEAVYYGLPPLDTLRAHLGLDFDPFEVKKIFLLIDGVWQEVPWMSQIRPISISMDSRQESIYLHRYRFSEYGDVVGIYTEILPYYKGYPYHKK